MKKKEFREFLHEDGEIIYEMLHAHCTEKLKMLDVDTLELAMLANSFAMYAKNAKICNDDGATQSPKEGGWDQVRPEYTVMKNEYLNILKHSGKYGLNPADRGKFFKGLGEKVKKGFKLNGSI